MEEKKYEYKGTVTIGTDEYRDLITDCIESKAKYERVNLDYWDVKRKCTDFETKIKCMEEAMQTYYAFVDSSEEIKAKYKLFLVEEKMRKENGVCEG